MIPLARWLETGPPAGPVDLASVMMDSEDDTVATSVDFGGNLAPDAPNDPRDECIARLEESLRLSQEEIEQVKSDAAQREGDLLDRIGKISAESIAENMRAAVLDLKNELEFAIADTLTPFIAEQVRQRAISELLGLIETVLSEAGSMELDVHAPVDLHGVVGDYLTARNINARLHDSSQVTITFGSLRSRFEELSSEWLSVIHGHNI